MIDEPLFHRGTTYVRRLRLAPGEAMPWHRDPYNRVTVILRGDALERHAEERAVERRSLEALADLDDHGVPSIIHRIPVNFPPIPTKARSFAGMGTPDIVGTQGTFSYYTDRPPEKMDEVTGGKVYPVEVKDFRVQAKLYGPTNTFRRFPEMTALGRVKTDREGNIRYKSPDCTIDFTVHLDPDEPVARIDIEDKQIILKEGEWSDWFRVDFEAVPFLVSINAIGRFYLQQVRPDFRLYVSPLQINPEEPVLPLSTPDGWSNEMFKGIGYFYTQTFPVENKGFSDGIFTAQEYWTQAKFVLDEHQRMLDYLLDRWKEGLLFFYFDDSDLNSHMLWSYMDQHHPIYHPNEKLDGSIGLVYEEMDKALGRVLDRIDNNTVLIVMSDHGFGLFYWGVNINSWLVEKGYLVLKNPSKQGTYGDLELYSNVDWTRSKAYGSGMNGIYVNLRGREKHTLTDPQGKKVEIEGIVSPGQEYDQLLDQLERDLLAFQDERNGQQVVSQVTRTRRDFHGDLKESGPDIIVGYNLGYRIAWASTLGGIPKELIVENDAAWSGDHAMDSRLVPGILVTNQRITLEDPALTDLTVAVLDEYGIPKPEQMIGRDCLTKPEGGAQGSGEALRRLKEIGYMR